MEANLGERIKDVRIRRGLTQRELAAAAGVSDSLIQKLERGAITNVKMETLHKIAIPLRVPTHTLVVVPRQDDLAPVSTWEHVRDALYRGSPDDVAEPATSQGVLESLNALMPAWLANDYKQVGDMLPALLRDALSLEDEGADKVARSRVFAATAMALNMTRQFDDAWTVAEMALDAAPDLPESMAAVNQKVWCLLRQGRAGEASDLAVRWADQAEPRFSKATNQELAAYGKMLMYVANAMTSDNRPGEAQDALSLARAAAARIGRDVQCNMSTSARFGPGTVLVITAETAALTWQPEKVLKLADRAQGLIPGLEPIQQLRHRLDVASAHVMLHQYTEAVGVMRDLRNRAPQWFVHQQYARDIVQRIVDQRRTLTPEMRQLADALNLPL